MKILRLLRNTFFLSLFLHVLGLGGVLLLSDKFVSEHKQDVSVDFISAEELAKLRQADELAALAQVVEQYEKSTNEIAPDKAKFLSAKNQKVTKETIAVNKGDFQNAKNKAAAKPAAPPQASAKAAAKTPAQMKNLFSNYDPAASFERQQKQQAEQVGQTGAESTGSGAVSQTSDYAKNVDKGLETLLNTREFKYYSYYNRIRRQLAQHWEGKVREKLTKIYKERRAPASLNEDKTTKIVVVLNSTGTLVNVQVIGDSGVRDLDDAAVEAFRAAAPFPNPPKGIIEGDGTVKIRWDFVLET